MKIRTRRNKISLILSINAYASKKLLYFVNWHTAKKFDISKSKINPKYSGV